MLILKNTDDLIQVKLGEAIVNNQCDCIAVFRETGTTGGTVYDGALVRTQGVTPVTFITSPSSADSRKFINTISIFNNDIITHQVTVIYKRGVNEGILYKGDVPPNGILSYENLKGWDIPPSGGYQPIKSFTVHGNASANFVMTNATLAERFAGNTTRHLFMVDLEGYTQVRLRLNQQVTSASVNTPLFRAKYYTSFNTTVGNFMQLGLSEQVQLTMTGTGYRDTGWINLATSARQNGVCIGFTELGGDGVADPALGATDILFR